MPPNPRSRRPQRFLDGWLWRMSFALILLFVLAAFCYGAVAILAYL